MSSTVSGFRRSSNDHFEPEDTVDPKTQRRLRGHLEQIDYTAFASNREVIGHALGHADAAKFQKLAIAAAMARSQWVAEALRLSEDPRGLSPDQIARLASLRAAYQELSDAYEAMRRLVERGYLPFNGGAPA